jgi:hypothetical protein
MGIETPKHSNRTTEITIAPVTASHRTLQQIFRIKKPDDISILRGHRMFQGKAHRVWVGLLVLSSVAARAQSPEAVLRQTVDTERTANQNDHTHWLYLEDSRKPKEHLLQWVASTPQGDAERVLRKNDQQLPEPQQRALIEKFLRDSGAQRKQLSENKHDSQQVDDLLALLPNAFIWTQIGVTPTDTILHFEPAPNFHPPTREARVFSAMAGDLIVDNQQHRIRSMSGHLIHQVDFGGGLLGKLKEGSSFSLEQAQVGPSIWELTAIHVHLEGNALIFKSISLQQDNIRSRFEPEPPAITLDQAATEIMHQPEAPEPQ